MTGFAERGDVRTDGHCLWCGARLRRHPGMFNVGYSGRGFFCTLTCGWRFGLRLAELGRRLAPTDRSDVRP